MNHMRKQPERPISAARVHLNETVSGGMRLQRATIASALIGATVDLGVDFASLISALQKYVDKHLAPVWGTPAKLVRATKPRDNAWTMLFVDTAADIRTFVKT